MKTAFRNTEASFLHLLLKVMIMCIHSFENPSQQGRGYRRSEQVLLGSERSQYSRAGVRLQKETPVEVRSFEKTLGPQLALENG